MQKTKRNGNQQEFKKISTKDSIVDIKKMIRNTKILQKISLCKQKYIISLNNMI